MGKKKQEKYQRHRKFGGKRYRRMMNVTRVNKKKANQAAERRRTMGANARVVPVKGGYNVYYRFPD